MKFGYTILYVQDVAATLEFYHRAFGLETRFLHESQQYGELETGTTTLSFATYELAKSNGTPFLSDLPNGAAPPMEVCFVTEDVPAAYTHAIASGAEPIAPPKQKPWGQTVAYVRDNNRFLVELCTPIG